MMCIVAPRKQTGKANRKNKFAGFETVVRENSLALSAKFRGRFDGHLSSYVIWNIVRENGFIENSINTPS